MPELVPADQAEKLGKQAAEAQAESALLKDKLEKAQRIIRLQQRRRRFLGWTVAGLAPIAIGIAYYVKSREQEIQMWATYVGYEPNAGTNKEVLLLLGEAQLDSNIDRKIDLFGQALRIEPDNAYALTHRGFWLGFRKRNDGALQDLNKAIAASPGYDNAYYYRGTLYKDLGRIEEAIADLKKVLDVSRSEFFRPKASEVLKELGVDLDAPSKQKAPSGAIRK